MALPTVEKAQAQALVLAAGRGERMRPLTDQTPKPLLRVQGQALLQWQLHKLALAGVRCALINTAWLGEQIEQTLGSSQHWHDAPTVALRYSSEGRDFGHALETAGGIVRGLPWLEEVFWVLAGDVFAPSLVLTEQQRQAFARSPYQAHLWLVPNPQHNVGGDFGLSAQGLALNLPPGHPQRRYTFSTVALYKRGLFTRADVGVVPGNPQGQSLALAPLLRAAMDRGEVSAELFEGGWTDVGTPERLVKAQSGV